MFKPYNLLQFFVIIQYKYVTLKTGIRQAPKDQRQDLYFDIEIQDLDSKDNLQDLWKISKNVSIQFLYFLKIQEYALVDNKNGPKMFEQLANSISTILKSIENKKYEQLFPYFYKILKTLNSSKKFNLNSFQQRNTSELVHRHELNQKSEYFYQSIIQQITVEQTEFLSSQNCTNFFLELVNKQIQLQNPQCVCCSQVFIKKFQIINKNPMIPIISEISGQKAFDRTNLQNYINCICNKGGGILIIGAKKANEHLIAHGVQFENELQIQEKQNQLRRALNNVRNVNQYKIERVFVHTNYVQPKNIHKQYMRICFRIFITPLDPKKISYIETYGVGLNKIYQVYQFNENMTPKKIICQNSGQSYTNLYKKIHDKFLHWKPTQNSHKNIECLRSHPFNSKLFYQAIKSNNFECEYSSSDEFLSGLINRQLKFKYDNRALLVFSSQKQQQRVITSLQSSLNNQKILYEFYKPYEMDFKEGRHVWLISFNKKIINLKNSWQMVQNELPKNQSKPVLMPVYQTIQVQKQSIDESTMEYIKKKLNVNFKDNYIIGTVKKMIKIRRRVYITFILRTVVSQYLHIRFLKNCVLLHILLKTKTFE